MTLEDIEEALAEAKDSLTPYGGADLAEARASVVAALDLVREYPDALKEAVGLLKDRRENDLLRFSEAERRKVGVTLTMVSVQTLPIKERTDAFLERQSA